MSASNFYDAFLGADRSRAMVAMAMLKHATPDARDCVVEFPRYRDAYFDYDEDGVTARIVVLTRTGGAGRRESEAENAAIRRHPCYLRDHDDAFDSTYALWWFEVPPLEYIKVFDVLRKEGRPKSLKEKLDAAVEQLKAGGPVPDLSGLRIVSSDGSQNFAEFLARNVAK